MKEINKIQKSAKTLDIILKVCFWASIAMSVLCVVVFAIMLMGAGDGTAPSILTLGSVNLDLADDYLPNNGVTRIFGISSIITLVLGVVTLCIGIKIVRNILMPMREGTFFSGEISKNVKNLGTFIIAAGSVWSVIPVIFESIILNMYPIKELFAEGAVTGMTVEYHFDLTFIIVAMVVYLLAAIFRYGEELQQQADETL